MSTGTVPATKNQKPGNDTLRAVASAASAEDTAGWRLVVILPALNEEATVASVLKKIPSHIDGIHEIMTIVVDDGSTDQTAKIARSAGAIVVSHAENRGVGEAFATGIRAAISAGADIIVNVDSDGQFNPSDIQTLIEPIVNRGFGFVTCSRFAKPEFVPKMPPIKKWGNYGMSRLVGWLTRRRGLTDVSCGFRAYSRDTALRLNLYGRFTYTQETFIDLASKGVSMTEVPLRVRGVREFGKSRVASDLWRYAIQTSFILLRAIRDTQPLAFFGSIAFTLLGAALGCFGFVAVWWLMTSHTSPWTSLLIVGTAALLLSVSSGVTALLADQVGRGRRIQEELLYYQRSQFFGQNSDPRFHRDKGATD
jgi:hypothetical protein